MDTTNHPVKSPAFLFKEELSHLLLQSYYHHTDYSIFILTKDGHILFFNQRALEGTQLRYGQELMAGKSLYDYRLDGDEIINKILKEDFDSVITTQKTIVRDREMQYGKETYWMRIEIIPLPNEDNGELHVLVTFKNIDEIKSFENQLRSIAWHDSHITKAPIATLLGLINILDKQDLSDDNRQIILRISEEIEKVDSVITNNVNRANAVYEKFDPNYSNANEVNRRNQ